MSTTEIRSTDGSRDRDDVGVVRRTPDTLAPFVAAGVLAPADVHAARTICRLGGDERDEIQLAVALAVRGPRLGHVCIDLATVRDTVTADEDVPVDLDALEWPDPTSWARLLADSPLVAHSDDGHGGSGRGDDQRSWPLTVRDGSLYLDRYWRYEQLVAEQLQRRALTAVDGVDTDLLREGLDRLFATDRSDGPSRQRIAAAVSVLRRLAVIAGGPGTGKTYTIARVLTLLHEQRVGRSDRDLRIALVAPTGKAAARMEEEIHDAATRVDTDDRVRAALAAAEASTIHRLLRVHPGNRSRFRHHHDNPLPHDVVVCDETSMVSLALMAKLLDALRPDARVILVGDPEQLASVEAGAVLGDIVGPTTGGLRMSDPARRSLEQVVAADLSSDITAAPEPGIGDGIAVLTRVHRFEEESGIADLATAIQRGDADATIEVLSSGRHDVRWLQLRADAHEERGTRPLRELVVGNGREVHAAARAGDAAGALDALDRLRILCAHRRGPRGVTGWVPLVERWLAQDVDGYDPTGLWYVGQPVLVTQNDHRLGIFNGDIGVAVAAEEGLAIAFEGEPQPRLISPTRLEASETVHAMTIHKSQGSQFGDVIVVLPEAMSPILTRELLYTAITRGRRSATVVGTEDAVRAAVDREVQRASGLRGALWD